MCNKNLGNNGKIGQIDNMIHFYKGFWVSVYYLNYTNKDNSMLCITSTIPFIIYAIHKIWTA